MLSRSKFEMKWQIREFFAVRFRLDIDKSYIYKNGIINQTVKSR